MGLNQAFAFPSLSPCSMPNPSTIRNGLSRRKQATRHCCLPRSSCEFCIYLVLLGVSRASFCHPQLGSGLSQPFHTHSSRSSYLPSSVSYPPDSLSSLHQMSLNLSSQETLISQLTAKKSTSRVPKELSSVWVDTSTPI